LKRERSVTTPAFPSEQDIAEDGDIIIKRNRPFTGGAMGRRGYYGYV
jgi:hypothetical protein